MVFRKKNNKVNQRKKKMDLEWVGPLKIESINKDKSFNLMTSEGGLDKNIHIKFLKQSPFGDEWWVNNEEFSNQKLGVETLDESDEKKMEMEVNEVEEIEQKEEEKKGQEDEEWQEELKQQDKEMEELENTAIVKLKKRTDWTVKQKDKKNKNILSFIPKTTWKIEKQKEEEEEENVNMSVNKDVEVNT